MFFCRFNAVVLLQAAQPLLRLPGAASPRHARLRQLARLDQLRRGSLIEQLVSAQRRGGSEPPRGPYPPLTLKQGAKTEPLRLTEPDLVPPSPANPGAAPIRKRGTSTRATGRTTRGPGRRGARTQLIVLTRGAGDPHPLVRTRFPQAIPIIALRCGSLSGGFEDSWASRTRRPRVDLGHLRLSGLGKVEAENPFQRWSIRKLAGFLDPLLAGTQESVHPSAAGRQRMLGVPISSPASRFQSRSVKTIFPPPSST